MKPPVLHFPFSAQDGTHDCRLELGWFGAERYYVDNKLVHWQWSLLGKTAKIEANGAEIRIRSHIVGRSATVEVSLDGNVIIENLLEDYNRDLIAKLKKFSRGPRPALHRWSMKVVAWLILTFLFL